MGYKLATLPILLFQGVIGCCELLTELKTGAFPTPPRTSRRTKPLLASAPTNGIHCGTAIAMSRTQRL
jgi:hypothetical protein